MGLSSVIRALLLLSHSHKWPLIKKPARNWNQSTINPALCILKKSLTKYRVSDMVMTLQGTVSMFLFILTIHNGPLLHMVPHYQLQNKAVMCIIQTMMYFSVGVG